MWKRCILLDAIGKVKLLNKWIIVFAAGERIPSSLIWRKSVCLLRKRYKVEGQWATEVGKQGKIMAVLTILFFSFCFFFFFLFCIEEYSLEWFSWLIVFQNSKVELSVWVSSFHSLHGYVHYECFPTDTQFLY